MGENAAAFHTAINSVQALGRGFDVNYDTRLLYCKGVAGSRIVDIDEEHTRDLYLTDNLVVPNVSRDIKNSQEAGGRDGFGVCSYNEFSEFLMQSTCNMNTDGGIFNKKASLSGHTPLGSFNAAFSFTSSKHIDAASTKSLCMDGFFIPLAKIQLVNSPIVLNENVRRAVPKSWDPPALASFIENFGTHVITSVTIGGKDVIYVKQHLSSPLSIMEIKNYVQDIGNQRFSSPESLTSSGLLRYKDKGSDPSLFNSQGIYPQPADKPQIEELRYFLEFQVPRVWAPVQDRFPGQQRKEPVCPSLQFSMMGQKLYVSQEQFFAGTILNFSWTEACDWHATILEGSKQNRLCIHLQHLASLPKILQPYWDMHVAIGAPKWQGPEEQDSRWFEPVKWKKFSHVSTAPIENPETFIGDLTGVYIVTGAQLGVWDFGSRNVLHMKLLYSRLPGCTIRRSLWDHAPNEKPKKGNSIGNSHDGSSSSSGEDYAGNKLAKFVDMSEMSKGPENPPGHWLVTGGKLGVEKGRIVVRVKYSLLNY
ncbi:UNVERIFIED_CONTAM: MACPF domain-containing protein CAD1 [Sesamum angustifolium]|uniref:MACPF domain-containing protein CAD1 n=1 Tax=Sesamum angustifolium TaxID=2727405 RepID=A0AAW2N2X8_9LAMI